MSLQINHITKYLKIYTNHIYYIDVKSHVFSYTYPIKKSYIYTYLEGFILMWNALLEWLLLEFSNDSSNQRKQCQAKSEHQPSLENHLSVITKD